MKVTQKGQITIPLPIRTEFGFRPGTDVEFVAEAGKVVLRARKGRQSPGDEWLKQATGIRRGKVTTAKIMKMTRGEA